MLDTHSAVRYSAVQPSSQVQYCAAAAARSAQQSVFILTHKLCVSRSRSRPILLWMCWVWSVCRALYAVALNGYRGNFVRLFRRVRLCFYNYLNKRVSQWTQDSVQHTHNVLLFSSLARSLAHSTPTMKHTHNPYKHCYSFEVLYFLLLIYIYIWCVVYALVFLSFLFFPFYSRIRLFVWTCQSNARWAKHYFRKAWLLAMHNAMQCNAIHRMHGARSGSSQLGSALFECNP